MRNQITDSAINWVPKSTVAEVRSNPPAGVVQYTRAGYLGRLSENGGLWIGRSSPFQDRFFIALTDRTFRETATSIEVSMM